jgi:cytochrome P450
LDGVTIKTGTYLYIPIWWIQRDAKHFPDPEAFLPERWVSREKTTEQEGVGVWHERSNSDDQTSSAIFSFVENKVPSANRDAFLAFSAGARNCPGKRFALQEATLALGALLIAFKFQPVDGYVLTPHRDGIVQMPKDGMPMRITKRNGV